tara:strand:+ start:382 stop:1395 length:1014 start_codon:yes stop_codon:yes gene_type:complete
MKVSFVQRIALLTAVLGVAFFFPVNLWAHAGHKHEAENPSVALPDVVARVNGNDIPGSKVFYQLKRVVKRHIAQRDRLSSAEEKAEAKKLIDAEIKYELIRQKASELGLVVKPEILDKKIRSVMVRFKSEKAFHKRLEKSGLTLDQYKEELSLDLLRDTLVATEVGSMIDVTLGEVRLYYQNNKKSFWRDNQARASVILIKIDRTQGSKAGQIAKEKIDKIYKEFQGGADFAELAKKYSQDSLSKKGGDLGYFTKQKMLKAFSDRAFQMEPGSVTKPFLTKLGWHILITTGKEPEGYQLFEEVKQKIQKILKKNKTEEASRSYLQALREKADIKTYF